MNMPATDDRPLRLVIHGGAGAVRRDRLKPERERVFMQVLAQSLHAGHAVLAAGGSSIDAVIAAIVIMEDSPVFNAGKGAVFSHEGYNELDASIMDGATRMAGAVAAVTTIRNPIRAAHAVMMHSRHVLLIGRGAESFAAEQALEIVEPSYFYTQRRWDQLQKAIAKERITLDHDLDSDSGEENNEKHGTVGAVALDYRGNLAAGTSTGGLTNKRFGRVGDTPIIGAGTYADNQSVAVSATGTGEMFIRSAAGFYTAAQIKLQNKSLFEAADHTLAEIATIGGEGGLIVLNAQGDYTMCFNTSGMFRGVIGNDGVARVGVFSGDESLAVY
ncbi:isoaspartyl peptidase/L-asparaginase [Nitrosomonas sp.]|uniref:isoaspartyl peptidase/L-asparaginase family protein n=2 Tax=Nitrosomonas sp. TaxID=42353 RepID=UPI0028472E81|nr:isoaspartyl peptidase/L-asparaginase [Nitrosomonas sp.]MCP5243822.1 isoaspartyl peptidase/L-asparaginase [Burkholderiales bacterium]MCP5292737.1 isoaspartyl peptidase/L-asparaginase [Burkholderiales bacterium]MDR4515389.1 isoaspartyl peptidase/L-asparaginase [Nitrosomonas sp.]